MNKNLRRLKVEEVRHVISEQSLKLWWVAECAGVHKTTLRRWLSGKIERVRPQNLQRLAEVLGTDGGELAEGA